MTNARSRRDQVGMGAEHGAQHEVAVPLQSEQAPLRPCCCCCCCCDLLGAAASTTAAPTRVRPLWLLLLLRLRLRRRLLLMLSHGGGGGARRGEASVLVQQRPGVEHAHGTVV